MKFGEMGCVRMDRVGETFIYFLLREGEVVYVGQTRSGIGRLASHKAKDYDAVAIMYCEPTQLDELEDWYMTKYKPEYNKLPNFAMNVSLQGLKKRIRQETGNGKLTIWPIRRAVRELGIEPFLVEATPYVKRDEADMVSEYFKRQVNGDGA